MSSRVFPTKRLRAEIDEMFATSGDLAGAVEQVARLDAQELLQTALEAEVTAFLGRDRYAPRDGHRGRPGRLAQRPLPDHGEDLRRAGGRLGW